MTTSNGVELVTVGSGCRHDGKEGLVVHQESGVEGAKMQWYAVNTKPHQEQCVEWNLRNLRVQTFCPRLKHRKVIRRVLRDVTEPLFPGYLFARFDLDMHYRLVNYAKGVRRLVAFGESPVAIDDAVIESIKSLHRNGYVTMTEPTFIPGELVKIKDGLLQGIEAVFEHKLNGEQRAMLLLRSLSYQARVIVQLESVVNL